jgi:mono/diheme cytochrome c family protein
VAPAPRDRKVVAQRGALRDDPAVRARPAALLLLAALAPAGCVDEERLETTGADLYRTHCAACHGAEGRGDGPVAASLAQRPADLTAIAKRAGGAFPEADVMATIDGRRRVAVHGPREMPVWGAVFESEHAGEPYAAYTSLLDSRALTDYLRSIQRE